MKNEQYVADYRRSIKKWGSALEYERIISLVTIGVILKVLRPKCKSIIRSLKNMLNRSTIKKHTTQKHGYLNNMKKDVILVTGANGFIGSHLVQTLNEQGRQVLKFDIQTGNDILELYNIEYYFK